jgi:hypothetical protein
VWFCIYLNKTIKTCTRPIEIGRCRKTTPNVSGSKIVGNSTYYLSFICLPPFHFLIAFYGLYQAFISNSWLEFTLQCGWKYLLKCFFFLLQFHIIGGNLGCSNNETYQNVQTCPMSKQEMREAEMRLNCKGACEEYMYHCLPNTQMEDFFEGCSKSEYIIGIVRSYICMLIIYLCYNFIE